MLAFCQWTYNFHEIAQQITQIYIYMSLHLL